MKSERSDLHLQISALNPLVGQSFKKFSIYSLILNMFKLNQSSHSPEIRLEVSIYTCAP